MEDREIAIKTENLTVIYDRGQPSETKALSEANVAIYQEDFVIIFGPSGCGKSTMLYSITGIEKPTDGKVFVFGEDITKYSSDESATFHRLKVGMVFQAYNLISSITVLDNVALPQIFMGVSRETRRIRAKILLQRFGILPQAYRLPSELSGGQQQRVGIARALINEQPIIFADEPVGNLDSKSAQLVLDILYDLNVKDKKTVILVTHDPLLLKYASHIIYMKDGYIVGEKRFTSEQRQFAISQGEQPFVSTPAGAPQITASPVQTISGEASAAEKSRQREEEAKKLVEMMGKAGQPEEKKEQTIGEIMAQRQKETVNH